MTAKWTKTGRILRGIGLGVTATLLVLAVHRTTAVRQAEQWTLDLRFAKLPSLPARDDIVHVDLDDKAIEQIGRWPWPRRRLGQLVRALSECGARFVALDILMPDPQPPRFVKEGQTDLYADDPGALLNPDAPPTLVLDDSELAAAMAECPDLILGMPVDIFAPERPGPREALVESLAARVTTRPALTRSQASGEMRIDPDEVDQAMTAAKQRAFRRRVRALLKDDPLMPRREVARRLLGRTDPRSENDDILRREYLRQRAMTVMKRFALPADRWRGLDAPRGRARPPLVTFAQAVGHVGSVSYRPDRGGVWRVPLVVKTDEGAFPQLALAVAAEVLAAERGRPCRISSAPGKMILSCGKGFTRAIPVDAEGFMVINWTRQGHPLWGGHHLSAVAAADVWSAREGLRRNADLSRLACLEVARLLNNEPVLKLFAEADRIWKEIEAARRARRARQAALLFDPAFSPATQPAQAPREGDLTRREAEVDEQIRSACKEMIGEVDSFYLAGAPADGEDPQLERLRWLRSLVSDAEAENAALRRSLDEAKRRLRGQIAGKIVLFGSVCTAAADFVATPLNERTPGVVVHGHVLNTILSGRFVRRTGPWLSGLLVLAAGALVTVITSTRGPVQSAICLLAGVLAYAAVAAVAWAAWNYWIIAVAPVAAMLESFAVVTAYRQLTEQRHKRQITNTFKQYLSPAMVDRLVDDPRQAALGGQRRQLSCLFSDLAGFTSLSERLGAEGTVNLLNRYLDRVGEIVQVRHGGTLSKYEGDGVFAFFGAPIPQSDHAARAMNAALEYHDFLPEFSRQLRGEGLLPAGADLAVRTGITAGEVFVGNMGSTRRIAYTAIGDSVNLAARLETANKFFGTRILVNEEAWLGRADGILGRPMGKILVVGKTEPVSVWEPLTPAERSDEPLRRLVEQFARGVALYAAGEFAQARECFLAIIRHAADAPSRLYLDLCGQALADLPDPLDFDGVIRLTEK